jgi:hypothetical protein
MEIKIMNELNINKLKEFNEALANLSDDVKDMDIDMFSIKKPLCGTPACFAGLISIVAKDLPELQVGYEYTSGTEAYDYWYWTEALSIFLGFYGRDDIMEWADKNPKIWGCLRGAHMFSDEEAYVTDRSELKTNGFTLNHRDLINWWAQVEKNITGQEIIK